MKIKIWTALILVYVIWGATYLGIRFAVETIPPFLMAGTRFIVAGVILYAWRRLAGDAAPTRGQWLRGGLVGLLMLLGGNAMLSLAEKTVDSGISALIIGSAPLWLTGMEALRRGGVRPNWLGILGIAIGFAGIYLLVSPSFTGAGASSAGIIILLFAAFFWSLGSIYSRGADLPSSSLLSTAVEMLGGAAGCFLVGSVAGEWSQFSLAAVTFRSWMGLLYLILFGSMVGFTAYAWLLRNAPVSLVATYAYVNPVVAILLGSLLAGEKLNAQILVSATVIIGSVVLINLSRQIKTRQRTVEVVK